MNAEAIKIEILKTLHQAAGHPLLEDVLHIQINTRVRPRPTPAVFKTCIKAMQGAGLIMSQANDFDAANPFWLLDEKGQAMAARLRL